MIKKSKNTFSRVISSLLIMMMLFGMIPVFDSEAYALSERKTAIMIDVSKLIYNSGNYSYINYGSTFDKSKKNVATSGAAVNCNVTSGAAIKWKVLDVNSNDDKSKNCFVMMENTTGNSVKRDEAQNVLNSFFDNALNNGEKEAIIPIMKKGNEFKMFSLTQNQMQNSTYGFSTDMNENTNRGLNKSYWLDGSDEGSNKNAVIKTDGSIAVVDVTDAITHDIRPAMNIDLNKIAFVSSLDYGKQIDGDVANPKSLKKVDTSKNYNDWKLTIKDDKHKDFDVSPTYGRVRAGESIKFNYEIAVSGENEYVSAILISEKEGWSGKATYYGRLKAISSEKDENGLVSVDFSARMSGGEYKLYIFSEHCNKENETDFSSDLKEIALMVDGADSNASLKPMDIYGVELTPKFEGGNKSVTTHYGEVENEISEIIMPLTGTYSTTKIFVNDKEVVNGKETKFNLSEGLNKFDIKTAAENSQSVHTYSIMIRRKRINTEKYMISLSNDVLKGYDSINGYNNIYFGEFDFTKNDIDDAEALKWRILDTVSNDKNTKALFVLLDSIIADNPDDGVAFGAESGDNIWETSDLKKWFKTLYDNKFSEGEQKSILPTTTVDVGVKTDRYEFEPCNLNNDLLFALSASECCDSKYGFDDADIVDCNRLGYFNGKASSWLLRSPKKADENDSIATSSGGKFGAWPISFGWVMSRPAMNIDSERILFTSAANGGKISTNGVGMLNSVSRCDNNVDWKFTLKDSDRSFSVVETEIEGKTNDKMTIAYSGATNGVHEYISAIITDENNTGKVFSYGRLKKINTVEDIEGTFTFNLPLLNSGKYNIKFFTEQYNGDMKTDYASEFCNVKLDYKKIDGPMISFDSMGGSFIESAIANGGKTILEPEKPTKTNSAFMGWYKSEKLEEKWDFKSDKIWGNTTLYARWQAVDFQATEAGTYSADVTLEKLGVDKACMVEISDGEYVTKAIYDDGSITFYVPKAGNYMFSPLKSIEELTQASKLSEEKVIENSYKGTGEIADPYHVLANILNEKANGFGLMWYVPTTWAGYISDGASERSSEHNDSLVKNVVFEFRDYKNGSLKASLMMDGSKRNRIPIAYKYPFPMSLYIEPTEEEINKWINNNELYIYADENKPEGFESSSVRSEKLKTEAVEALNSNDEILFMHDARRENFGPYTMKFEVKNSYGFEVGDSINLKYMGGTHGGDYQGGTVNFSLEEKLNMEMKWTSKYDKPIVVDKNGYVTFDLFNSGMFKLSKTDDVAVEQFTVNFQTNGANQLDSIRVNKGEKIELPKTLTKLGFVFDGWYQDEKFIEKWNFDTDIITDNMMIYAKWVKSDVNYDVEFVGAKVDKQVVANCGKIIKPENPVKGTDIFMGWYKSEEHVNKWNFEEDSVYENMNLYAYFEKAYYMGLTKGRQILDVNLKDDFNTEKASLMCIINAGFSENIVTVNGKITVDIPEDGNYALVKLSSVSEKSLSGKAKPLPFAYTGDGSSENPWVILANLTHHPEETLFGLNWYLPGNWAGYSDGGANNEMNETYDSNIVENVTFESRDEVTGKLIAAINFDGTVAPEAENARLRIPVCAKRPFDVNFRVNPSEDQLIMWFDDNTLYNYGDGLDQKIYDTYGTSKERTSKLKAKAEEVITAEKQSLLVFDDPRELFGPVTIKLDAKKYGYNPGEEITILYLGGTNGGDYHAVTPPLADRLAQEMSWGSKNTQSSTVDDDGYITMAIYNGGMFKLFVSNGFIAKFETNGGSGITSVVLGNEAKIEKPIDPVKENCKFDGWYINKELTEKYDFDTVITAHTILYANWIKTDDKTGEDKDKIQHTVKFNTGKTNGMPNATIDDVKVESGKFLSNPGMFDNGYGFLAVDWYTDEGLNNKYSFSSLVENDLILYPKYLKYILKDDLMKDGGSGTQSSPYLSHVANSNQSKIAWKALNTIAGSGQYWKQYATYSNSTFGKVKYEWTFNGSDMRTCQVAQPYYTDVNVYRSGKNAKIEFLWRTAIEGKVNVKVDVSDIVKEGTKVEVSYVDGSCDGKVIHTDITSGEWVNTHHTPSIFYGGEEVVVENGYITLSNLNHGGTYLLEYDDSDIAQTAGVISDLENTNAIKIVSKAKIKNGVGTMKITDDEVEEIVSKVIKSKKEFIGIEAEYSEKINDLKIELTPKQIKNIVNKTDAKIKIESEFMNVTLSKDLMTKLASDSGKEITVDIKSKDEITNINFASDGKIISVFDLMDVEMSLEEENDNMVAVLITEDGNEKIINKSIVDGDKINFSIYGNSNIKIKNNKKEFTDIDNDFWGKSGIEFSTSRELFLGVNENEFAPNNDMTRGMVVTVLHRLEGLPEASKIDFSDVEDGKYYEDAVSWAADENIVTGTQVGFEPEKNIGREELITIMYRYAKEQNVDITKKDSIDKFVDNDEVSTWAKDAMEWAIHVELIKGKENSVLDPKGNTTRAEVATIVNRMIKLLFD